MKKKKKNTRGSKSLSLLAAVFFFSTSLVARRLLLSLPPPLFPPCLFRFAFPESTEQKAISTSVPPQEPQRHACSTPWGGERRLLRRARGRWNGKKTQFFSPNSMGKRGAASERSGERELNSSKRREISHPRCPGSRARHPSLSAPNARARSFTSQSMAIENRKHREHGTKSQGRALFFFSSSLSSRSLSPLLVPSNRNSPLSLSHSTLLHRLSSPISLPCTRTRAPSAARARSAGARCRRTCRA